MNKPKVVISEKELERLVVLLELFSRTPFVKQSGWSNHVKVVTSLAKEAQQQ